MYKQLKKRTKKEYAYQSGLIRSLAHIFDFLGEIIFFCLKKKKEIKLDSVSRILVAKLDHIGDGLIMLPFIKALKEIFEKCKIDVLVPSWTQEIFEYNPAINNVIVYDYFRTNRGRKKKFNFLKTLELIKNLKRKKYDIFIDARGEPFVALLGFLIQAKHRIGFIGEEIGSFLYTYPISYNKRSYEGDKYLNILKIFGYRKELSKPRLYPTKDEKERVENIKSRFKNKIIGIHLTSGELYKIWPTENFVKLVNKISKKYPQFDFAILGTSLDKDYIQYLVKNTSAEVQDLSGVFNLRELYYFISKLSLFVGNDSALVHFAASLSIPTVDILNSVVNKERWVPPSENIYVIEGKDINHFCETKNCPYPCPNMAAITVEEVFRICDKILNKYIRPFKN